MNEELFEKIAQDAYIDEMEKIAFSPKATMGTIKNFYSSAVSGAGDLKKIPKNIKRIYEGVKGGAEKAMVLDRAAKAAKNVGIVGGTGLLGLGALGTAGYYGGKAASRTSGAARAKELAKEYAAATASGVKDGTAKVQAALDSLRNK